MSKKFVILMDNVQEDCYFNSTPSSQTFRFNFWYCKVEQKKDFYDLMTMKVKKGEAVTKYM
jgi:hypothetical protein